MSAAFEPTWFPYPLWLVVSSKDTRQPEMFTLLKVSAPIRRQGDKSLLPIFTSVYQAQRFIETEKWPDPVRVEMKSDEALTAALQEAKALGRTHVAFDPPRAGDWPDVYAIDEVLHVIKQRKR